MSRVTEGIMRITQDLDKISGLDGIVADKIERLEIEVREMVSDILENHSEASTSNYGGNNKIPNIWIETDDKETEHGEELISLVKWAELNDLDPSTARTMARKGKYKTAHKIGRNWVINKNEPNIYKRRKKSK